MNHEPVRQSTEENRERLADADLRYRRGAAFIILMVIMLSALAWLVIGLWPAMVKLFGT
jgi:hypothetical protein